MNATRAGGDRVTGLFVYPLKSAGGIAVDHVAVDRVGLQDDRRWMIVDADGGFVSQRTHPRMALLGTRLLDDVLEVDAPGAGTFTFDRGPADASGFETFRVWFTDRFAVDCGAEAAEWAADFLGIPCRVVQAVRPSEDTALAPDGRVQAGFADARPALAISEASLADLNGRMESPLPMDRFRPNIVVGGFGPFEEDVWGERHVGSVRTGDGGRCPRCATTLVDQITAEKGVEPLRTLATFRKNADGAVDFGVNVFFREAGVLHLGDEVERV